MNMSSSDPDGNVDTTIQYLLMDLDSALLLMDVADQSGDGEKAETNYRTAHQTYDIILWRTRSIRSTDKKLEAVERKLALLRSRLEGVGHDF